MSIPWLIKLLLIHSFLLIFLVEGEIPVKMLLVTFDLQLIALERRIVSSFLMKTLSLILLSDKRQWLKERLKGRIHVDVNFVLWFRCMKCFSLRIISFVKADYIGIFRKNQLFLLLFFATSLSIYATLFFF